MDFSKYIQERINKNFHLLKHFQQSKFEQAHSPVVNPWNVNQIKTQILHHQQGLKNLSQSSPTALLEGYFIEDLGFGIKLEMVYIPGGRFLMGAPQIEEGSENNERPQHYVTLKPFYMGKYTITQEQWGKVVNSCPIVERDLNSHLSHFQGDKLPVEQVSWYDAVEFCMRLANKTGRQYRLPSESEWEYACRAGSNQPFSDINGITRDAVNCKTKHNYSYSVQEKSELKTTPVGTFKPNSFGLFDTHGNVWEWCADTWHENYQNAPDNGEAWVNEEDSLYRSLRGGSWGVNPVRCRSAYRFRFTADSCYDDVGFRVVFSCDSRN